MRLSKSRASVFTAAVAAGILFLAGPSAAAVGDDGVGALLEGIAEAYGGRELLSGLASYRMTGTVTARMRGKEGPTSRTFERPARLRVELRYPEWPETRVFDGRRGWRTGKDGRLAEAFSFRLQAMVLQAARADLPWILLAKGDQLRDGGGGTVDGSPVRVLELPLGEGLSLSVAVDLETHRILRSAGVLSTEAMKTAFIASYSDFRPVGGILFPFREENYASGMHTGSTVIERIEINPDLPAGTFMP